MNGDGKVIEFIGKVVGSGRSHPEHDALDLANERIRNLAFQASKLPATLSRSEIEELGLAVLMHMRRYRRIV